MKFHLSTAEGNMFTGHGADYVRLGVVEYRDNVLVTPERVVTGWAAGGFDTLTEADFAALVELKPEVVLLGTGASLRFPHPRLTRALTDARIGVEVMDTPAACRTFNILAAEGRRVVAAVIVDRR
ncbi:MAG: Mth938-like domain-containing protein [Pseudomonadota bacterium]|nr:Mth938-like domain-containing protein [Pseudomonadota bacterium]